MSHSGLCGGAATGHQGQTLGQRPACIFLSLSDSRTQASCPISHMTGPAETGPLLTKEWVQRGAEAREHRAPGRGSPAASLGRATSTGADGDPHRGPIGRATSVPFAQCVLLMERASC